MTFSLVYCSYDGYKARKLLTAIDWNSHLGRNQAINRESGDNLVTHKYNPRTGNWCIKKIMTEKNHAYVSMMPAKAVRRRFEAVDTLGSPNVMGADDSRQIAPTIAKTQPQPTKELAAKYYSRMSIQ
eukprot:Seg2609.2 transcript_id=Seg2609.2/GoldUCD/mRNA.D3Y31 product="hypothetical protein" protein_id=Seg2609.2/GoldUCD/D3Y31